MLVESDSEFHALQQLAKRGRRSTRDEMDAAVAALQSQKESWLGVPVRNRLVILDELIRSFATVSEEWVSVSLGGKGALYDEYAARGDPWYILTRSRKHGHTVGLVRDGSVTIFNTVDQGQYLQYVKDEVLPMTQPPRARRS